MLTIAMPFPSRSLLLALPFALGTLLLAPLPADAQRPGALTPLPPDEPLPSEEAPAFTSDRPGFANTSGVAAVGHLTAELGLTASIADDGQAGSLPNLSLRVGVFDWLELRARAPSAMGLFGTTGDHLGLTDPRLGFKIGGRLADSLAVSAVMEASLPLGTSDFSAPEPELYLDLNIDWNFWGPLTLTPNAVARVLAIPIFVPGVGTFGTRRLFEGGFSLKLTWQILEVLSAFVQSYVLISEVGEPRAQVGGGLAWMVLPTLQLDVSFDSRVTERGDPPTIGLGMTALF